SGAVTEEQRRQNRKATQPFGRRFFLARMSLLAPYRPLKGMCVARASSGPKSPRRKRGCIYEMGYLGCLGMNPVALITGASRGIGRGIALELAAIGYDLLINFARDAGAAGRTAADWASVAQACGRTIHAEACQADVSLAPDRRRLIDFAKKGFGRLDLLVNNAGVAPHLRADILESTEESFDRLIGINVKGPYFLTQLAARWMVDQVKERGGTRESVDSVVA